MQYGMILLKCFYDYDLLIILQKNQYLCGYINLSCKFIGSSHICEIYIWLNIYIVLGFLLIRLLLLACCSFFKILINCNRVYKRINKLKKLLWSYKVDFNIFTNENLYLGGN